MRERDTGEMNQKQLLIIIPAYNEEKNINRILDGLGENGITEWADVLVMNDASSDSTNWIVKERGHALVTHVFNLGYGSALQLGYKYAIRRGYQYVVQMDADGQHDVCNIAGLYSHLKTADGQGRYPDIVLGARFMKDSAPFPVSLPRRLAYSFLRTMIRVCTGNRIADPTTGLQGLSRRAVLYYSKYRNFDSRYPDANMLIQMLLLGFHLKEVPAVMHARTEGISMHSGIKPVFYMMKMFLSILTVWFRFWVLKVDSGITEEGKERRGWS